MTSVTNPDAQIRITAANNLLDGLARDSEAIIADGDRSDIDHAYHRGRLDTIKGVQAVINAMVFSD